MKNKLQMKTSIFLILLVSANLSWSQSQYYELKTTAETYQPISNPDLNISDSSIINSNSTLLSTRFANFFAFGEQITGGVFSGKGGWIVAFSDSSDFAFDPLNIPLQSNGESEFRAKLITVGQDSALEIEWHKFGLIGFPSTDFVTFKARVFYNKEIIEYYYGSSKFSNPANNIPGPFALVIHFNKGFATAKEQLWLKGDPSNPTVVNNTDSLNTFPDSGTVYRFTVRPVGIAKVNGKRKDILIYPNPTEDWLTIKSEKNADYLLLVDQLGKINRFEGNNTNQIDLSLKGLETGQYILILNFKDGTREQSKVIIK